MKHSYLQNGRWSELSLLEQMGNISSEVGRSFEANVDRSTPAFERALELFDMTLADVRWKHRYKELARAREEYCKIHLDGDDLEKSSLEKYFMQFAIASRLNR